MDNFLPKHKNIKLNCCKYICNIYTKNGAKRHVFLCNNDNCYLTSEGPWKFGSWGPYTLDDLKKLSNDEKPSDFFSKLLKIILQYKNSKIFPYQIKKASKQHNQKCCEYLGNLEHPLDFKLLHFFKCKKAPYRLFWIPEGQKLVLSESMNWIDNFILSNNKSIFKDFWCEAQKLYSLSFETIPNIDMMGSEEFKPSVLIETQPSIKLKPETLIDVNEYRRNSYVRKIKIND